MQQVLPVVGLKWYGSSVFELALIRAGVQFVPGDCLALYAADGRVSRPYSIASAPEDEVLRFAIRLMPGGEVSAHLASLKSGDSVGVSAPFGWFRPGEHAALRPFHFLATGTGIAPFLAHLRTPGAPRPASLLYGVARGEDLVEPALLRSLGMAHFFVSREDVSGCHRGRITERLDSLGAGGDADYYLCGLDAMIDEVTERLESRGVPIERIHRECFFNAAF